jgi:hypothetical protein
MSNLAILPAPNLETGNAPESPWDRERRTFHQLLPSLLGTHTGQYLCSSAWWPKRTRAG